MSHELDIITKGKSEAATAHLRDKLWVQGLCLGLYVSRMVAEISAGPWRMIALLPLIIGGIVLGLALVRLMRLFWARTGALVILLGYVVCPWVAPALAWGTLFVVVCLLFMCNVSPVPDGPWPESAILLAALALYVSTLAPTVLPADSGEFQLVSYVLGIAHPPGYALYTMLGKLFTYLPVGDVAYRLNLFGAVCGALTLAVMVRSIRRTTGSTSAALVAAGMLGLCPTFWAQSTTANIRSLTALFTMLCLALLLRWGEEKEARYLVATGACFGLGVGHHLSLATLGLPFAIYLLARDPRIPLEPRRWVAPLAAFAASLLVLLYLPLRSLMGAPFDPSPIRSWSDFASHVLALGFRGDMFYLRSLPRLVARLRVWAEIVRLQFGPVLCLATGLALFPLAARRKRVLLLLLGTWAINTLVVITYKAPQTVEYLLPSYVALATMLGYGLGILQKDTRLRWPTAMVLTALLALSVAVNGLTNYGSFRTLHEDTTARDYAEAILRNAPSDTLLLSNWHHATVFWYLQQVEGLRPDVEVRYVYPEGATPNDEVWLRRIAQQVTERPIIVTNWFQAYEHTDYRWIPFHRAWLVRQDPLFELPERIEEAEAIFGQGIRLLGFQLESEQLAPGETVSLRVYWQSLSPLDRDYSSFVQLLGPNGVVGQDDIVHRSSEYLPGEIRVDAYRFPTLLHTLPGEYRLITGFYYIVEGGWRRLSVQGSDYVALTNIRVQAAQGSAVTLHPRHEHYANGLQLAGIDYDRSVPGQTRLYLHWWRPRLLPVAWAPWRASPTADAFVQLRSNGRVVSSSELPTLMPGSAATLALDVPDDLGSVSLAMVAPDGQRVSRLGPWHRTAAEMDIPLPRTAVHYVPLGGEMAFLGYERLPGSLASGQEVWLRSRFLALRPLTADYAISTGLERRDGTWEIKSDGTPAMGAIPTLKWVRGWRVEDPRALTIAADAPTGEAITTLTVYDAFTLEPLHVLDERLVQGGQGTRLEVDLVRIEE